MLVDVEISTIIRKLRMEGYLHHRITTKLRCSKAESRHIIVADKHWAVIQGIISQWYLSPLHNLFTFVPE